MTAIVTAAPRTEKMLEPGLVSPVYLKKIRPAALCCGVNLVWNLGIDFFKRNFWRNVDSQARIWISGYNFAKLVYISSKVTNFEHTCCVNIIACIGYKYYFTTRPLPLCNSPQCDHARLCSAAWLPLQYCTLGRPTLVGCIVLYSSHINHLPIDADDSQYQRGCVGGERLPHVAQFTEELSEDVVGVHAGESIDPRAGQHQS